MKREEATAVQSGYPGWPGHSWRGPEAPFARRNRHLTDLIVGKLLFIVAVLAILAGSLAQANLLLLLARRKQPVVRVVLAVALLFIAIVAIMVWVPILTDGRVPGDDGDWYWRLFGVAAIMCVPARCAMPVSNMSPP